MGYVLAVGKSTVKIRLEGWYSKYDEVNRNINFRLAQLIARNCVLSGVLFVGILEQKRIQPKESTGNLVIKRMNKS